MGFLEAFKAPVINDVSTDLSASPPCFTKSSHSTTLPESFIEAIKRHYPDVQPLRVPNSSVDAVLVAVKNAATTALPSCTVVHYSVEDGVMELLDVTRLMRFKDDVSIRAKQDGSDVVIDIRSASRLGKGDMGCNANRIRTLMTAIKNELNL